MACFIVPAGEAIVAAVVKKAVESKEDEKHGEDGVARVEEAEKIPFSRKLKWLTNMLWGGAALLAFEHLWHGEVVPWPPFLTAASSPAETADMLHEMATVGVTMSVIITAVWCGILGVAHLVEKKAADETSAEQA